MRRSLAAILLLCACTTSAPPHSSSAELARIADEYWKRQLSQDVGLQIKFGIPTEHLPDPSFMHAEAEAADARKLLARLQSIDPAQLNEEERITLRILRSQSELAIENLRHFWLQSFITPYATPLRIVSQVFTDEKLSTTERVRLLRDYRRYVNATAALIQEQRKRGILVPKPELPAVRALINRMIAAPDGSAFRGGDDSQSVKDVIASDVNPALQSLAATIGPDYESAAPAGVGLSQYPGGADAYRFFIRTQTSLDMSPEEIHALGLREVARINGELDAVRQQAGYQGTLAEFRGYLKT
ncbi:MAG: DUF885 family protein, partial [Thermoanaerobaculia bacterium]